ncbi:hypothetical protein [Pseudomonas sp. PLMAX]|uniref:hypothetical protein n=1 Tax=Pseudomonas sp. PLMAX TaxID=2201998 RepID=UPI0038B9E746
MNGWQRLWVVVCLVISAFTAYLTYDNLPSEEKVTSFHTLRLGWLQDDLKRLTEKASNKPGPWNNFGEETVEGVRVKMQEEDNLYKKELAELPAQRRDYITTAFMFCFGFSVSLYVAGWVIGWIYRGFRPKRA